MTQTPQIRAILKRLDRPLNKWAERHKRAFEAGDFRALQYCRMMEKRLSMGDRVRFELKMRKNMAEMKRWMRRIDNDTRRGSEI